MLLLIQRFVFLLMLYLQSLSYSGDPPFDFGGGDPSEYCFGGCKTEVISLFYVYRDFFSGLFMIGLSNEFYLQVLLVLHH